MNLFGLMDVSGSALKAERVRAEVVASNMANAETTRTEDGGPYRRHHVVFAADGNGSFGSVLGSHVGSGFPSIMSSNAAAGGVSVAGVMQDESVPLQRYDPGHPDAGPDGYVAYPDINPLTEMVDLMGATRSYGMNATAVQAEKGMITASLDLLK
ncbi:flagellar basal body rod protein FlgC [Granulicella sibirica]|nr:flagellar basal body rod protein FlgC [Granulicella sibirica]